MLHVFFSSQIAQFSPQMLPIMRLPMGGAFPKSQQSMNPLDMLSGLGQPPLFGDPEGEGAPQVHIRVMHLPTDDEGRPSESESPLIHLMGLGRENEEPELESPIMRLMDGRENQESDDAPRPAVRIIRLGGVNDDDESERLQPPSILRSLLTSPGSPRGSLLGVGHNALPGLLASLLSRGPMPEPASPSPLKAMLGAGQGMLTRHQNNPFASLFAGANRAGMMSTPPPTNPFASLFAGANRGGMMSTQPPANPFASLLAGANRGGMVSTQPPANPFANLFAGANRGGMISTQPPTNPFASLLAGPPHGGMVSTQPNGFTIVRRFSLPVHDEEDEEEENEDEDEEDNEDSKPQQTPLHVMFRAAHDGHEEPEAVSRVSDLMRHFMSHGMPAAIHARLQQLENSHVMPAASSEHTPAHLHDLEEPHAPFKLVLSKPVPTEALKAEEVSKRKIHDNMGQMKTALHELFLAEDADKVRMLSAQLYASSAKMHNLTANASLPAALTAKLDKFLTEVTRGLHGVERTLHLATHNDSYAIIGNYTGVHKSQLAVELHERELTVTVRNETGPLVEHSALPPASDASQHATDLEASTFSITLPKDIAPTRMKAKLHGGALSITVPRVKDTQVSVSEE